MRTLFVLAVYLVLFVETVLAFPRLDKKNFNSVEKGSYTLETVSFPSAYDAEVRYYLPHQIKSNLRLTLYQGIEQSSSLQRSGSLAGFLSVSASLPRPHALRARLVPILRSWLEIFLPDGLKERFDLQHSLHTFVSLRLPYSTADLLRHSRATVRARQWLIYQGVFPNLQNTVFHVKPLDLKKLFLSVASKQGTFPVHQVDAFLETLVKEKVLTFPSRHSLPNTREGRAAIFSVLRGSFFRYQLEEDSSGSFLSFALKPSFSTKPQTFVFSAMTPIETVHTFDSTIPWQAMRDRCTPSARPSFARMYIDQNVLFSWPDRLAISPQSLPKLHITLAHGNYPTFLLAQGQTSKLVPSRIFYLPNLRLRYKIFWKRGGKSYRCSPDPLPFALYEHNVTFPLSCFRQDPVLSALLRSP